MLNSPSAIGMRRSFGFGDWLGLATTGHVLAARQSPEIAPFFLQRTPHSWDQAGKAGRDSIRDTVEIVRSSGYSQAWGADADGLDSIEAIYQASASGYTWLSLDVSSSVGSDADLLDESALRERVAVLEAEGAFEGFDWKEYYIGRFFSVGHRINPLQFDEEDLMRAAVKYARATLLAEKWALEASRGCAGRPFEIEISVAGAAAVTTPLDHLFLALELQRRGIPGLIALGLHYEGQFIPGIDFQGDAKKFEDRLKIHVGIAKFAGPYKLSFHHAADKFALYPVIGRLCGNMLHLKTASTSYLEALRVVARTDGPLFAEIANFSRSRINDPALMSRTLLTGHQLAVLPPARDGEDEDTYLDHLTGRQLLAATGPVVLSEGVSSGGHSFRNRLRETVSRRGDLYAEILERHFLRHFSLLNAG
ncbi:MAG TPA: tagaturonate epimerase family protein [Candidatus Limnocylindria bacterium]|nr:tagaturonate epimerase family protein [Candidatus Limnocylindria bacterium]